MKAHELRLHHLEGLHMAGYTADQCLSYDMHKRESIWTVAKNDQGGIIVQMQGYGMLKYREIGALSIGGGGIE